MVLYFRAWFHRIEQAKTSQEEREKLVKACSDSEADKEIIRREVTIYLKLEEKSVVASSAASMWDLLALSHKYQNIFDV